MKIFMLAISLIALCFSQAPLINEVMSLNASILADEDDDYPDWIELYNPGSPINLNGYGLSDDAEEPHKWTFPNISLATNAFLVVFASDKNRRTPNSLHTNFKIKSRGERILLSDASGRILDDLTVPPLAVDHSYGRTPADPGQWAFYSRPTPRAANDAAPAAGYAPEPLISPPGGLHSQPLAVALSSSTAGSLIRYTTNGADPNINSHSYLSPITINRTTVLKARCFETGKLAGAVVTYTYFVDVTSGIPLVSISTHPDNLFDDDIGIYVVGNGTAMGGYPSNPIGPPANYWEDWERPVHLELYEPDGRGLSVNAGIKMFGKTTRTLPQKSFAIFMRSGYGADELEYALFPGYSVTTFKSFLLRNGGSDNTHNEGGVQFRDGLTALLLDDRDVDIDNQLYRPCHLYLNGDYWGIYEIREKLNEDYLASHHGVDPDEVDILDDYHTLYPLVVEGSAEHYNSLIDYLLDHDLQDDAHADYVKTQMDVDNYLTYMAVQIFFANHDGPGHNCKFWRSHDPGSRYRWLLYDTDHSFAMRLFVPNFHFAPDAYMDNTIAYYREEDGPDWPNPPESTFLFRKILENENFTCMFINKLADFMNSFFSEEVTLAKLGKLTAQLDPEIGAHLSRWGGSKTQWRRNVSYVENFLANRRDYLHDHVIDEFNLAGLADVHADVQPRGVGRLQINSLTIEKEWSGIYYRDVPIQLAALPDEGFRFVGWEGIAEQESQISMTLHSDVSIKAFFEIVNKVVQRAVSDSFVMKKAYPNPFNAATRIEFYVPKEQDVRLSIFDVCGRRVRILLEGRTAAGQHSVVWNGLNEHDKAVASGVYLVRLKMGERVRQLKVVLVD
ncbi:CotH kinase family protein [candidate division KSB1 bacterium]|nr:CotH kinase family protein [candidate division KSB1 bacterium]